MTPRVKIKTPINDNLVGQAVFIAYKNKRNINKFTLTYPIPSEHTQSYQNVTKIPKISNLTDDKTRTKYHNIHQQKTKYLYIPLKIPICFSTS